MKQFISEPVLWKAITFGQSTDLGYSIGVLPEHIGINQVTICGQDVPLPSEFEEPVSDVIMESRGGKIQPVHDGLTFYYTQLPASSDFSLSAFITVYQLGPENHTAPNGQESCGIMLRDCNGPARQDPPLYGYEEYPAASNMTMLHLMADSKTLDAPLHLTASFRKGVVDPSGNSNVDFHSQILEPDFFQAESTDGSNRYCGTFHCSLQRCGRRICLSYKKEGMAKKSFTFPISSDELMVLDPNWIYAGFFVSRNAKIKVSQICLKQCNRKHEDSAKNHPSFSPAAFTPSHLYAAPNAPSHGLGTFENPISIDRAISLLPAGGTIHLQPGIYPPIHISQENSSTFDKPKRIQGTQGVSVQPGKLPSPLFILDADYWEISGLDLDGKNQRGVSGFMIYGSHNQISDCQVHHTHTTARDAGFMITTIRKDKSCWPSYNQLTRCISYENHDDTDQNADGFACRTGAGQGNCFVHCVSHHNSDDGFDLFNNINDGPNGAVHLENCIAYENNSNGFKLGGEGREVAHVIRHCLAFNNGLHGFTDNFNPGPILLEYNTAYDNRKSNYFFRPSPYKKDSHGKPCSDCILIENHSFHTDDTSHHYPDVMATEHIKNHWNIS